MTREDRYNMPPKGLFGKRCRIKHCSNLKRGFVYRIVNDGVRSNAWRELPLGRFGKEPVLHDTFEEVVFVVCDTLIDESSKIEKVALKDIEIIEQEPCDKCAYSTSEDCQYDNITETIPPFEDCISRQATIEYLCINMNWHDEDGETADDEEKLNAITDLVNGVPPVTPQPKMGRWIFVDEAKEHARCSECNSGNVDLFDGKLHNYCEVCGAKMQGVQE